MSYNPFHKSYTFVCQLYLTRLNVRCNIRKQTTLSLQAMAVKDTATEIRDQAGCGCHRSHQWGPPPSTWDGKLCSTPVKRHRQGTESVSLCHLYTGKAEHKDCSSLLPHVFSRETGKGIEKIVFLTTLVHTMYSTAPCNSMLRYQRYVWKRSRIYLAKAKPYCIQATSLKVLWALHSAAKRKYFEGCCPTGRNK